MARLIWLIWAHAAISELANAQWLASSFAAGPYRVQWPAAAFNQDTAEMWTFGGRGIPSGGGSFDYIDEIWAYDTLADVWRNGSAPGGPSARQLASAVFAAQKVWIFGGSGSTSAPESDLYAYDTQAASWSQLTPSGSTPPARSGHAAVFDSNAVNMWIIGGSSSAGVLDAWAYDIVANSWSKAADGPGVRRTMLAAVLEPGNTTKIWLFGGELTGQQFSQDLLCLDIQANSWTNWTQQEGPGPRRSATAGFSQNQRKIWIHGGYFYDGSVVRYSDVWAYDIQFDTWTEAVSSSSMQRYNHVAAMDSSGRLWTYGGTYSSVVDTVHVFITEPATTTTVTTTTVTTTTVTTTTVTTATVTITTVTTTTVTTTTVTTTTLTPTTLPNLGDVAEAVLALASIEETQRQASTTLAMQVDNTTADGLLERQDSATFGMVITKALASRSTSFNINFGDVEVELPGPLLEGTPPGGVWGISAALLTENSSAFQLFASDRLFAQPMVSLELYYNLVEVQGQLPESILLSFPVPALPGSVRPSCVFWDEELRDWSTEGLSLVGTTNGTITCATSHLSLFAVMFLTFICSNAAAIFSQEGLQSLLETSWVTRPPAIAIWLTLFVGIGLLAVAAFLDHRHRQDRAQLLRSWESNRQVELHKMRSKELPEEKVTLDATTLKNFLLKHLHSKILLASMGVDLPFLKKLYAIGGYTATHERARNILDKFYTCSLLTRVNLSFRSFNGWMNFSYPIVHSSSLERCAAMQAKVWSSLALVAIFYSTTSLAAELPSECEASKGLVEMIVRGAVVAWVGAVIGILPILAVQVIQLKLIRTQLKAVSRIFFWGFILMYFALSVVTVCIFISSVSALDGVDFLISAVTGVIRTLCVGPAVLVCAFLLVAACVDAESRRTTLPFTSGHEKTYKLILKRVAIYTKLKDIRFNCQVPGHPKASTTVKARELDGESAAEGICLAGLEEDHLILVTVFAGSKSLGSAAVHVRDWWHGVSCQDLPLQRNGRKLNMSVILTAQPPMETARWDFPTLEDTVAVVAEETSAEDMATPTKHDEFGGNEAIPEATPSASVLPLMHVRFDEAGADCIYVESL